MLLLGHFTPELIEVVANDKMVQFLVQPEISETANMLFLRRKQFVEVKQPVITLPIFDIEKYDEVGLR